MDFITCMHTLPSQPAKRSFFVAHLSVGSRYYQCSLTAWTFSSSPCERKPNKHLTVEPNQRTS